ncbi:MAG: transglycosylase SLT domain-containing protein [Bryobacterales bacterium]|nr:transglycosylase SLT domain-containing protein [Bryobacterales bacterium]
MNVSDRLPLVTATAAALVLSGCAAKQPAFQNNLVPATTAPQVAVVAMAPPAVTPNLYLNSGTPRFVLETPDILASKADLLLASAEEAFEEGRQLYDSGDRDAARERFDEAVDLLLEGAPRARDRAAFTRKLDEMVDAVHRLDLAGLGAGEEEPGFERAPLEDILQLTFPLDPKLTPKVRAQLQATVSQLPLSLNESVLSFINYFNGRGRKTLEAGLRRAGRYRPMIERILAEQGIPQEIIHLAQAESGFMPRAISRMRATGMWQFMQWRGREYGLMQTRDTDDRFDPEKATLAAARHLRDLYDQFGDWYLAVAAYNCGPGNVERAVERTGYADFWELRARRALPVETSNYVPIILAMTIMTKNAKEYGLEGIVPDPPLEYDVLEMDAPTNLALIADLTGAPLAEIRELNPSLLRTMAPAGHAVRVPKGQAGQLTSMLQSISPAERASSRIHRVSEGESIEVIGKRYGASPVVIARANNVASSDLEEGDMILIPRAAVQRAQVRPVAAKPAPKRTAARKTARRTVRR